MIRFLTVPTVIVLSVFLLFGCAVQRPPTEEERLQKAQEYEASQQYDEALKEYSEITASAPESKEAVTAHYRSANIYYKQENYDKAIFEYTKVLQLDPENFEATYLRGVCYAVLKRVDPAEADLKKAIEINPDFASSYYVLGDIYLTKGEIDAAISNLTKAIELDPENPEYYNRRATAYYNKGEANSSREDYLRTIDDYTKIIETAPEFYPGDMHKWRGNAYLAIKAFPEAIEDFTAAIKMSPADPVLYNERGLAYMRGGELSKAKEDFVKAIEIDPAGRAGEIAYGNLELLASTLEERAAAPQTLSQDDIDMVNSLEQEWAMNIDKAVPLMKERNFSAAEVYIEKARNSLSRINDVLVPKNYNTGNIDRIVAMNKLTTVYSHLNDLSAYASNPNAAIRDWAVVTGLFQDTNRELNEAEAKFHEVPQLQGLCREIRVILSGIETEIKKAMNIGRF